jgi:hypothetical protein
LASTRLDRPWDSIGLATSDDGVHFNDHGPILSKAKDAYYLGAGHTWKVGDTYYLNFSEDRGGVLEIFFAESTDLLHWRRIPARESVSRLEPRWYAEQTEFSSQRWDNIWVIDEGPEGYFGYVTAVAAHGPVGLRGTCALVTSPDGRVFTTGAPVIPPGVWGDKLEIGGVEKIQGRYFMLAAQAEIPLGLRWTAHNPRAAGGVYVQRSDTPAGPFERDPRQSPLLVSAPEHYTYFARFYPTGEEMLCCHHSITPVRDIVNVYPKAGSFLAPLKKVVTSDALMSLRWWEGKSALKGQRLDAALEHARGRGLSAPPQANAEAASFHAPAGGQLELPAVLDLRCGIVFEATLRCAPDDKPLSGAGILIGSGGPWEGTLALADSSNQFVVGPYNGYAFRAADSKPLSNATATRRWRVLIRNTLVEYYLDDQFVQAYTLPSPPSGRLALVAESSLVEASQVSLWQMTLGPWPDIPIAALDFV